MKNPNKRKPVCKNHPTEAVNYSETYDSYFCKFCRNWLEKSCDDEKCKICLNRPERPQE